MLTRAWTLVGRPCRSSAAQGEWSFKDEVKKRRRSAAGSRVGARGYSTSSRQAIGATALASGPAGGRSGARGCSTKKAAAAAAAVTYSPSYTVVPTFECFNSCGATRPSF